MVTAANRQTNQSAFRQLKASISSTYRAGRYVAISDGTIVGDAEDLESLCSKLRVMGKDPRHVLIVQAGVDYPEYADIFSIGTRS